MENEKHIHGVQNGGWEEEPIINRDEFGQPSLITESDREEARAEIAWQKEIQEQARQRGKAMKRVVFTRKVLRPFGLARFVKDPTNSPKK